MGTGNIEIGKRREDLPMGRGGLDLYARDWMTAPGFIPDGNRINTKLDNWLAPRSFGGLGSVVPGQNDQALDEPGLLDFSRYWDTAKNLIPNLEALGPKIIDKVYKLGQIRASLEAQGRVDLIAAMQLDINKINADIARWWECKEYIDQYKSVWSRAAQTMGLGGLGFVFIPWLTYAALAGIVFIVTYGLGLVATYKHQTNVLDQVAEGKLSAQDGAILINEAAKTSGGGMLENVSQGIGNAVTLVGVGIAAYVVWGLFKS